MNSEYDRGNVFMVCVTIAFVALVAAITTYQIMILPK